MYVILSRLNKMSDEDANWLWISNRNNIIDVTGSQHRKSELWFLVTYMS